MRVRRPCLPKSAVCTKQHFIASSGSWDPWTVSSPVAYLCLFYNRTRVVVCARRCSAPSRQGPARTNRRGKSGPIQSMGGRGGGRTAAILAGVECVPGLTEPRSRRLRRLLTSHLRLVDPKSSCHCSRDWDTNLIRVATEDPCSESIFRADTFTEEAGWARGEHT